MFSVPVRVRSFGNALLMDPSQVCAAPPKISPQIVRQPLSLLDALHHFLGREFALCSPEEPE